MYSSGLIILQETAIQDAAKGLYLKDLIISMVENMHIFQIHKD